MPNDDECHPLKSPRIGVNKLEVTRHRLSRMVNGQARLDDRVEGKGMVTVTEMATTGIFQ